MRELVDKALFKYTILEVRMILGGVTYLDLARKFYSL